MPLVNRILAILRKAEFGFFGVVVLTDKHTPRLKGEEWVTGAFFLLLKLKAKAGDLVFAFAVFLGFFKSWLKVGIDL